jgi:hypothetical protein
MWVACRIHWRATCGQPLVLESSVCLRERVPVGVRAPDGSLPATGKSGALVALQMRMQDTTEAAASEARLGGALVSSALLKAPRLP